MDGLSCVANWAINEFKLMVEHRLLQHPQVAFLLGEVEKYSKFTH